MASKYFTTTTRGVRVDRSLLSKIRPSGKPFQIWDSLLPGYHLYIGKTGTISYRVFYRTKNGKQNIFTIGRERYWTPKQARDEARGILAEVARGKDPAREKQEERREKTAAKGRTLEAVLNGDYWDLHLSTRQSGKATQDRIKRAWKPFLKKDLADITVKQLARFRSRRLQAGIKPQTLNRDRSALITLFGFAVEQGLIDSNPLAAKTLEPLKTEDDKRVRYLGMRDKDERYAVGERERFMGALGSQSPLFQAIVGLALSTGMRRGEIFGLTWDRVDMRRRQIVVDAVNSKNNTTRQVPLNDSAMEILRVWKKSQGNVHHFEGLVFPSPQSGKRLVTLKNAWNRLVTEAELMDFRFHDLRHDYASRLVQAGVPLYEVSRLLGHSSMDLTQRYAHLDDDSLLNAAKKAEL